MVSPSGVGFTPRMYWLMFTKVHAAVPVSQLFRAAPSWKEARAATVWA